MSGSRWLYSLAVGGFLAAILLAAPALAQGGVEQNGDQERREQTQPNAADQNNAEGLNGPTTAAGNEQPGTKPDNNNRPSGGGNDYESFYDWIITYTNDTSAQWLMAVSGVAATIISFVAVILIWCNLRAAHRAIREAERATEAAQETIRVTEKVNERELRAYMSLAPSRAFYEAEDKTLIICVEQENSGQTPAKKVRFSGQVKILPDPLPDGARLPTPKFGESVNVVAPGRKFEINLKAEKEIDPDVLLRLTDAEKCVYFVGHLRYVDIFGETHNTIACWSYSYKELTRIMSLFSEWQAADDERGGEPLRVGWTYAGRHNNAT